MALWKKAPQVDPRVIEELQARIDADPVVQAFRAGYGSPGDPWTRGKGGIVKNPDQLSEYIAKTYPLPEGYNASQQGQVVYGNETPLFRQLALASLPITGPLAIQGLAGLAGGAAAGGASGAATGGAATGAATSGTLGAATAIPGVTSAAAGGATLGTATAGGGGVGLWGSLAKGAGKFLKFGQDNQGLFNALGQTLGAGAEASAQNRDAQMNAEIAKRRLQLDEDVTTRNAQIAREAEGRAGRNDAWRGLQSAEYVANAQGYTPREGLPSYGFGPKAATDAEKAGAAAMRAEVMKRLEGGNPIPEVTRQAPFEFSGSTKPGLFERIAGYAGPALVGIAGPRRRPEDDPDAGTWRY